MTKHKSTVSCLIVSIERADDFITDSVGVTSVKLTLAQSQQQLTFCVLWNLDWLTFDAGQNIYVGGWKLCLLLSSNF